MSFISKLFGKKKVLPEVSFESLKADMHSHLIPGIDDGSPNMATSIALIKRLNDLGYEHIITTPHVMSDYYRNSSSTILRGRDGVREELYKKGIDIGFDAAAEYFLDEHFQQLIEKKDILTFAGNKILFELSFIAEPPMFKQVLFDLQMAGYQPILAHPERYTYWHKNTDMLNELADRDIELQLNINSLSGIYSPQIQKTGERMIEEGLVSYIGSDCHHMGHLDVLQQTKTTESLHKLIAKGTLKNHQLLPNRS